jgi:hypothetical protein
MGTAPHPTDRRELYLRLECFAALLPALAIGGPKTVRSEVEGQTYQPTCAYNVQRLQVQFSPHPCGC